MQTHEYTQAEEHTDNDTLEEQVESWRRRREGVKILNEKKRKRFNRIFIPCLKQIGVTFIMDYTNYIQFFFTLT